ncbi:MAG: hypothetical protein IPF94_20800 [Betaproteobacteria bacterium]|nr:hypothetical protein [Betaproteobacteria bacterium]
MNAWHRRALGCTLHTGRTRTRSASIWLRRATRWWPMRFHGAGKAALGMTRQALHATELKLAHPVSRVPLAFACPPPADFQAAWQQVCGAGRVSGRRRTGYTPAFKSQRRPHRHPRGRACSGTSRLAPVLVFFGHAAPGPARAGKALARCPEPSDEYQAIAETVAAHQAQAMNTAEAKRVLETALICATAPLPLPEMRALFDGEVGNDTPGSAAR